MRPRSLLLLAPLLALGTTSLSRSAAACGGTFCDSGPTAMPVDQTGENVLFAMENGRVEAHVQIQYTGDPERFAWIVPMPKVPSVEVGSELLFDQLLLSTVPSYGFTSTFDQCGQRAPGDSSFGGGGTGGSGGAISADAGSGPSVVVRQTVGAFEVVVLQGGTASQVSQWLSTNGYQDIPSAPALLQPYVEQNYVFVALKLTGGAGIGEIHPVVFRYEGSEPCVPIKLTAVAAAEDMGVRTFFLGKGRVVPTNYKHVVLNPLKLDWPSFVANYGDAVSNAADSPLANGHAFITEYAGPSNVVAAGGVFNPQWDASKFVDIQPELVIDELEIQGIAMCEAWSCQFMHPLVGALLDEYLPRPAGVTPEEFYDCLSCYSAQIDRAAWNAADFAKDYDDRIVKPGQHAADLLARHPYLTRMFTTISPAEMTEDPMFHERADLGQVALPGLATRRVLCDSDEVYTLPDGREVALGTAGQWPDFAALPWIDRVEEFPLTGDPIVLADHRESIDVALAEHNATQGWPARVPNGAGGTTAALDDGSRGDASPGGGCACSTPGGSGAAGMGLAFAGLAIAMGAARRRRRR